MYLVDRAICCFLSGTVYLSNGILQCLIPASGKSRLLTTARLHARAEARSETNPYCLPAQGLPREIAFIEVSQACAFTLKAVVYLPDMDRAGGRLHCMECPCRRYIFATPCFLLYENRSGKKEDWPSK